MSVVMLIDAELHSNFKIRLTNFTMFLTLIMFIVDVFNKHTWSICLKLQDYLSFTNGVSEANVVKWKVSKKGIKNLPICIWMGERVSVCPSSRKSWITFDGINSSRWNFQHQSNFGQVIFLRGCQTSRPSGYSPGPKWPVSRKSVFI